MYVSKIEMYISYAGAVSIFLSLPPSIFLSLPLYISLNLGWAPTSACIGRRKSQKKQYNIMREFKNSILLAAVMQPLAFLIR